MPDYSPLIARAIAGLDPSAPGESRRALYERARAALIAQLRGVQPPLSESEITRERLSLEEAVRKVESEAAQRARDATRSGADGTRGARAGDAFRATTRPGPRPGEASSPPSASQSPPPAQRRRAQPRPPRGAAPPAPAKTAPQPRGRRRRARRGQRKRWRPAAAPPAPPIPRANRAGRGRAPRRSSRVRACRRTASRRSASAS